MLIEQQLHGYNNGHHLIAGSVNLPLKDTDRMSYLSDWSGYVNPYDKDTCYITAYPLEESGYYVIAKSWYAEEMSRPGCVWTHSLIVDLDRVEQNADFCALLKLFKRPDKDREDFRAYTKSIETNNDKDFNKDKSINEIDSTRLMFLAAGLLDRNKPLVYAIEQGSDFYIDFCIRLLQYIPLGILKEISLCSGSASARKMGDSFFNLQFVVGKGGSLIEVWPDTASKPVADKGFQFWMDSLIDGRKDVAQMIRRFSSDIGNDSMKFLAVNNLLKILSDKIHAIDSNSTINDILTHLTSKFVEKNSGMFLKRSFLNESVTKLFCEEREYILTLATTRHYISLDYDNIDFRGRVEKYRKENGAEEYVNLLVELSGMDSLNEEGRKLLEEAMDGLGNEEITSFANQNWNLFKSIVTLNSKLLEDDYWIDMSPTQFLSLFSIFQREVPAGFTAWEKLFSKLIVVDTFVSDSICKQFDEKVDMYVSKALDKWNSQNITPVNCIIMNLCMRQKENVLNWMKDQTSVNQIIRNAIKKSIQPDEDIVVRKGSAAWKAFVKSELEVCRDANQLVYIYILGFNWHDYDSLSYIKAVLPYIYDALSVEKFNYASWKRIEKYTGEVPFWRFWDNCQKVLIGVKEYCKAMKLDTKDIENFTTNQKLNGELAELWKKG